MKCKTCNGTGEIQSNEWLKISELKIEVHDKGKSWKELELNKREDELLTAEECIFLANNPKYNKILKMDGSSSTDDFYIKQPFILNKKNGYVAGFVAGSDGAGLGCGGNPAYSVASLGVRLVRRKKNVRGVK